VNNESPDIIGFFARGGLASYNFHGILAKAEQVLKFIKPRHKCRGYFKYHLRNFT